VAIAEVGCLQVRSKTMPVVNKVYTDSELVTLTKNMLPKLDFSANAIAQRNFILLSTVILK